MITAASVTETLIGVTPDEVVVLPTAAGLANGRDPVSSRLLGVKISPADAGKLFPHGWPAAQATPQDAVKNPASAGDPPR
jgi:hypothetical protein